MDLTALTENTGLSMQDLAEAKAASGLTETTVSRMWEQFQDSPQRFLASLDAFPETLRCSSAFYLFSCFAVFRHSWFQEHHIPDTVYFDTFRDLAIWHDVLRRTKGINGLKQYRWMAKPLLGELYRLGRLEFEPDTVRNILWIHIPEGPALLPAAVDESLSYAAAFFPSHFGLHFQNWQCESWMLARANREFMRPDSNILKFAARFRLLTPDVPGPQAVEWVFDWPEGEIPSYPETTGLQRAMKRWLLDGGVPVEATGSLKEIPEFRQKTGSPCPD